MSSSAVEQRVALFFSGDQITAAGTCPEVMQLQDPKVQVALMAEKFPHCTIMRCAEPDFEGGICNESFLVLRTKTDAGILQHPAFSHGGWISVLRPFPEEDNPDWGTLRIPGLIFEGRCDQPALPSTHRRLHAVCFLRDCVTGRQLHAAVTNTCSLGGIQVVQYV